MPTAEETTLKKGGRETAQRDNNEKSTYFDNRWGKKGQITREKKNNQDWEARKIRAIGGLTSLRWREEEDGNLFQTQWWTSEGKERRERGGEFISNLPEKSSREG